MSSPVSESARIQSLDVLRGFALLGILLMNIIGFGLHSAAYSNPGFDLSVTPDANLISFILLELFAEGTMRCLFSILFGAGLVLFLTGTNAKSGWLHYKRNFWLLAFGLVDAYILLWLGDILINYAICGALLFLLRNKGAKTLLSLAIGLILLISAFNALTLYGLSYVHDQAQVVANSENPTELDAQTLEDAKAWDEFIADYRPTPAAVKEELNQRQDSYLSAFSWNMTFTNQMMLFVLPVFLLWDALAMMLIGMALFKANVLQGGRSNQFYVTMIVGGLIVGLGTNGFELHQTLSSNFDIFKSFNQMKPSYHLGRLGMAAAYIGIIVMIVKAHRSQWLSQKLASVGRMALTNYLTHSLICLYIFTGAGLGLVGELERYQLYLIVLPIWIFQLWISDWWLARYKFGPVEWLWRALTYGERPAMVRSSR